jgi:hypothetical protein
MWGLTVPHMCLTSSNMDVDSWLYSLFRCSGPDVAEPEPHSRCSGADRHAYGRTPTPTLTSSPMATRRSAARLIRSTNSIDAAAPATRPPLLDQDSQGSDRLLPIFRRQRCRPRTSHHHNRCAALRSRHGQNQRPHGHAGTRLTPPKPAAADSAVASRRHGA